MLKYHVYMFHHLQVLDFDTTFSKCLAFFMMKVWSSDPCGALAQPVGEHNVRIATDFSDSILTTSTASSPDHPINWFIFPFHDLDSISDIYIYVYLCGNQVDGTN